MTLWEFMFRAGMCFLFLSLTLSLALACIIRILIGTFIVCVSAYV